MTKPKADSVSETDIEPISIMDVRFMDPQGWYVEYQFDTPPAQVDRAFNRRFGYLPAMKFRLYPGRSIFAGPAPGPMMQFNFDQSTQ